MLNVHCWLFFVQFCFVALDVTAGATNLASCEREAVADEVSEQCSKKLEKSPFLCDLAIKEGDGAEAVAFENRKEASVERNQEAVFLKVAGNLFSI